MNDDESLLTYIAGMDARLDRMEQQIALIHSALSTMTEIALLTFNATGTTDTLPAEVFDDPITERAIARNRVVVEKIRRKAGRTPAELAELFLHGTLEQIAAEPRLRNAMRGQEAMEQNIEHVFQDDPSEIPKAYLQSRQRIADALAAGRDVVIRPVERERDKNQDRGLEDERER